MNISDQSVVLVLSGGNALGAYHAGGYQALHDRGIRPNWVIGTSTGAINGAIICGNADEDRLARLADYWGLASPPVPGVTPPWWSGAGEDMRRTAAASAYLMFGQPTTFAPRLPAGAFWSSSDTDNTSFYDTAPLAATLERLVDFERLNSSATHYTATAVDLETGAVVTFDTASRAVSTQHVLASGALLPAFPPVEVGGRLMGDGGLAANLPVDVLLAEPSAGPTLCIALDLLPLGARRPRTLGEAASRMQDLMFASQSRRAIAAWQALYDARDASPSATAVTLLHLSYDRQEAEVAGKAFDYSPQSVIARWAEGYANVAQGLDRIEDGTIALGRPGLQVWRPPVER